MKKYNYREIYIIYRTYAVGGGICEGEENARYPNLNPITKSHIFLGACKNRPKATLDYSIEYEPIEVEPEIFESDKIYVITGLYQDGNTFQQVYGNLYFPPFCAVCTLDEAERYKNRLETDKTFGVPWNGYFSRLQDILIEEMELK